MKKDIYLQFSVSTSASGKVTVTSAAMAAAVVANPNWKPVTTEATSSGSTHPVKAPYSPRSNLLSPVKFGDQLKPYNRTSTAISTTPSTSTMAITPGTSASALSTPTSSYAAYRYDFAKSAQIRDYIHFAKTFVFSDCQRTVKNC